MARTAGERPAGSHHFGRTRQNVTDGPSAGPATGAWDDHVSVYETVFEPFTLQFAPRRDLGTRRCRWSIRARCRCGQWRSCPCHGRTGAEGHGDRRIDPHGRPHSDESQPSAVSPLRRTPWMVRLCSLRTQPSMPRCRCWALSCFRMPSAAWPRCAAWCAPAGVISVVTWTQPQNYELAAELRAAIQSVWPEQPPAPLPAQLRYREESDFRALFKAAGLGEPAITTVTARLEAPSARWLSRTHRLCARHGRHDGRPRPPRTCRHRAVRRKSRDAPGQGADRPRGRGFCRHGAGPVTFPGPPAK